MACAASHRHKWCPPPLHSFIWDIKTPSACLAPYPKLHLHIDPNPRFTWETDWRVLRQHTPGVTWDLRTWSSMLRGCVFAPCEWSRLYFCLMSRSDKGFMNSNSHIRGLSIPTEILSSSRTRPQYIHAQHPQIAIPFLTPTESAGFTPTSLARQHESHPKFHSGRRHDFIFF